MHNKFSWKARFGQTYLYIYPYSYLYILMRAYIFRYAVLTFHIVALPSLGRALISPLLRHNSRPSVRPWIVIGRHSFPVTNCGVKFREHGHNHINKHLRDPTARDRRQFARSYRVSHRYILCGPRFNDSANVDYSWRAESVFIGHGERRMCRRRCVININ